MGHVAVLGQGWQRRELLPDVILRTERERGRGVKWWLPKRRAATKTIGGKKEKTIGGERSEPERREGRRENEWQK